MATDIYVHICTCEYRYVYICKYMQICVIYVHIYVQIDASMYIYAHISPYVYICTSVCVSVYICTYACIYIGICKCIYRCVHIRTYMYIYIYIGMSIYVHICTCMSIRAFCFATQTGLNDAWVHTNAGKHFAWPDCLDCALKHQRVCHACIRIAVWPRSLR